jgi:hypothetical protein
MQAIAGMVLSTILVFIALIWVTISVYLLAASIVVLGFLAKFGMFLVVFSSVIVEFSYKAVRKYTLVTLTLLLSVVALLTGCSTPAPPVTITKVVTVKQKIPEAHLSPCVASPLFDKEGYISSEMYTREEKLTLYVLDLLSTISVCNKQITEIRKLNSDNQ